MASMTDAARSVSSASLSANALAMDKDLMVILVFLLGIMGLAMVFIDIVWTLWRG